jgi:hypothetical protein
VRACVRTAVSVELDRSRPRPWRLFVHGIAVIALVALTGSVSLLPRPPRHLDHSEREDAAPRWIRAGIEPIASSPEPVRVESKHEEPASSGEMRVRRAPRRRPDPLAALIALATQERSIFEAPEPTDALHAIGVQGTGIAFGDPAPHYAPICDGSCGPPRRECGGLADPCPRKNWRPALIARLHACMREHDARSLRLRFRRSVDRTRAEQIDLDVDPLETAICIDSALEEWLVESRDALDAMQPYDIRLRR